MKARKAHLGVLLAFSALLAVSILAGCANQGSKDTTTTEPRDATPVESATSGSTSAEPEGAASAAVAKMLRDRIATFNEKGGEALRPFYAEDAIVEQRDQEPALVTPADAEFFATMQKYWADGGEESGMRLESTSIPIQIDNMVAEALTMPGDRSWTVIAVYQLDEDGRIKHQWLIGPHD